jgi:hypothetical protein
MKIRLFATLTAIAVCIALLIYISAKWEPKVFAQMAPTPGTIYMCEGASPIPNGWVITNEVGSNQCAYPAAGVTGRQLTIQVPQYMPPPLTICADAPVPAGYVVNGFEPSPNKCNFISSTPGGTPGNAMTKNIQAVAGYPAAAKVKTATQQAKP